jgi:hypothetical protein
MAVSGNQTFDCIIFQGSSYELLNQLTPNRVLMICNKNTCVVTLVLIGRLRWLPPQDLVIDVEHYVIQDGYHLRT